MFFSWSAVLLKQSQSLSRLPDVPRIGCGRRPRRRRPQAGGRLFLEVLEARNLLSAWVPKGPAPIGLTGGGNSGRIAALAADPTDPNTIYIAAAGGGVWKTSDGGGTWTALTDDQPTDFMGAIAVAPSNPNVVYAGTGEANLGPSKLQFHRDNIYYGLGVLASTDAGATWTLLGTDVFYRRTISKIVVDPTDPNTVYAAVGAVATNGLPGNTGVWKSTDGGASWVDTTASISTSAAFSDVAIDPANPQVLYAAAGEPGGDAANGVYESTDGGATWLVAGNLPTGASDGHLGRITLALAPSDPQTLYASIVASGLVDPSIYPTGKLYKMMKTTDGGATWTQLTSTPEYFGSYIDGEPDFFGDYDTTLAVDPSNPSVVYAGGGEGGFIRSTNGGASWSSAGSAPHVDHHGIGFDASGRLLVGTDGGIWRQVSPGSTSWSDLNGNLAITQFQGIALHPTDPNIIYGGTQDNGTIKYTGNPDLRWTNSDGGDGGFIRADPNNPATVYHTNCYDANTPSLQHSFFRRSSNSGGSWTSHVTGFNLNQPGNFFPPFVMDPVDSSRLILGTSQVYETTNQANNWSPLGGFVFPDVIDAVAATSDVNTAYASSAGRIFVTFDHGATWSETDPVPPQPGLRYEGIAVDPTNPLLAYVVAANFGDVTGGGHVWMTADGGGSWADISGNLPDVPAWTVVVQPGGSPSALYVGTDNGAYASFDQGTTWAPAGDGLPHAQVHELVLNNNLGLLAAATHGRGVWELSLAPSSSEIVFVSARNLSAGPVEGLDGAGAGAGAARPPQAAAFADMALIDGVFAGHQAGNPPSASFGLPVAHTVAASSGWGWEGDSSGADVEPLTIRV